jgi:transcriptional regulator with XRE-family HTH domain
VETFQRVIDKATKMCGTQAELAERLGVVQQAVSAARNGRKPLPKAKLEALASLVQMEAAELWELQELANMPRRNPFKHALSSALAFFFVVNLSTTPSRANALGIGANGQFPLTGQITHCRYCRRCALTIAEIVRSIFGRAWPMNWNA